MQLSHQLLGYSFAVVFLAVSVSAAPVCSGSVCSSSPNRVNWNGVDYCCPSDNTVSASNLADPSTYSCSTLQNCAPVTPPSVSGQESRQLLARTAKYALLNRNYAYRYSWLCACATMQVGPNPHAQLDAPTARSKQAFRQGRRLLSRACPVQPVRP